MELTVPPNDRVIGDTEHVDDHNLISTAMSEVGDRLDDSVFNVRSYGAVGDGVTDDQPAFMAALAAAPNGGIVLVPQGTYLLGAAITGNHNGIRLTGSGGPLTTRLKAGGNFPILDGAWEYCLIEDLTFDANSQGSEAIRVFIGHTTIRHCTAMGWTGEGFNLNDGTYNSQFGGDLGYLNYITHCDIVSSTGYGIYTTYRFTDSWIMYCNIGSTLANIRTESGPMRIIGNHLDGSPEYNLEVQSPRRITVSENILEGALKSAIYHQMPSWETGHQWHELHVVGNHISNGGYADPGVYPAIHWFGKSATDRSQGLIVAGNLFAVDQGAAGWSYAVEAKWADELTITGNQWGRGYDEAQPVKLLSCGSVFDITGNGGRNGHVT